jgi:hypothetical protein
MVQPVPHFHVPLNLPHAGRVARRILLLVPTRVQGSGADATAIKTLARELEDLLSPYTDLDENPPEAQAQQLRDRAAALARRLVDHIERGGFGEDRLGQCVRNLFECLELGLEGALISLRAGENPHSLQRPV